MNGRAADPTMVLAGLSVPVLGAASLPVDVRPLGYRVCAFEHDDAGDEDFRAVDVVPHGGRWVIRRSALVWDRALSRFVDGDLVARGVATYAFDTFTDALATARLVVNSSRGSDGTAAGVSHAAAAAVPT